jgi:hypothetical protein
MPPARSVRPAQCTAPLEHLVRVHTVSTSHQRNTRTGLQCQLRNPPLLRHRPESARAATRPRFHPINHDDILALKPDTMPEGKTGRLRVACRGCEIKLLVFGQGVESRLVLCVSAHGAVLTGNLVERVWQRCGMMNSAITRMDALRFPAASCVALSKMLFRNGL